MTGKIYIISGFLGAGKTTLIQRMLKEVFYNQKVALIENDFGEISIDASVLRESSVEVTEIHSGCICCSLSGDFVKALHDLLVRFEPEVLIIEPSGVGKLSDIVKACSDPELASVVELEAAITVVDAKRCRMYRDNFGEFFEDQVKNASLVLLSHLEDAADKLQPAVSMVNELNPSAPVHPVPQTKAELLEVLFCDHDAQHSHDSGDFHDEEGCSCSHHKHSHEHHHGDGACECGHEAEEVFDTVTIRTDRIFDTESLEHCMLELERLSGGRILRAKGIVQTENGALQVQYIPGDLKITACTLPGNTICIIGHELNQQELIHVMSGE